MAESFENLDNILHNWEKVKNKKSIVEELNRYEKRERMFYESMGHESMSQQVGSAVFHTVSTKCRLQNGYKCRLSLN